MGDRDYLDEFSKASRTYGDRLKMYTPNEAAPRYGVTLEDPEGAIVLSVETEDLAVTLWSFLTALDVIHDHGMAPVEAEAATAPTEGADDE